MQRINEKPQVINDYEAGRAIPNNQIMNKLERALGKLELLSFEHACYYIINTKVTLVILKQNAIAEMCLRFT